MADVDFRCLPKFSSLLLLVTPAAAAATSKRRAAAACLAVALASPVSALSPVKIAAKL